MVMVMVMILMLLMVVMGSRWIDGRVILHEVQVEGGDVLPTALWQQTGTKSPLADHVNSFISTRPDAAAAKITFCFHNGFDVGHLIDVIGEKGRPRATSMSMLKRYQNQSIICNNGFLKTTFHKLPPGGHVVPPRRNGGSCSGGFGPHYELRGRGNHDDSDFGWVIISSPPKLCHQNYPIITVHLTPAAQRHRYYRLFAIQIGKNLQQDFAVGPDGFLTRVVHNEKEGNIALQDISYDIQSFLKWRCQNSVSLSPRFDVGYIIRRSEYALSGFERKER
ncbi:hypothetical protein ALC53_07310 [Atta colombica]|uniref:Uncharacterized protein n=1 Tax=Atta colombica TaxID=520822 RepID=A0A195BDM4_9HYME|nr:hypothetical protein ALC53_07310 [Atta colombica]